MIFTFMNPLTSVDGASVSTGMGTVTSDAIVSTNARQPVVDLTGVSNAQTITVNLTNVTDSLGNSSDAVPAAMGLLLGDTNGNGSVSASDIGQTKAQSGQAAGGQISALM